MRRSMRLRNSHSQLRAVRRWLLRIAIASFVAGWLSILLLAAPFVAHGESVNLDSYGATASGWAIQPYVLNDEFLNIPATDESTPYVFVAIDNTPSANARAAYFYPGTAINAILNNENAGVQIPNGVAANYPGTGSASSQAGPLSDGVATQAGAAKEEALASEGYAQATAGLVSFQFAPGSGTQPPVPGGPTAVPTIAPPPLPTTPGGSGPTPTPQPKPGPSPSPTPICIGNICLTQPVTNATGNIGRPLAASQQSLQQINLPDIFEQRLATLLRAAEVSNPRLLKLAGGHMAAADANLPYAAADEGGQATAQVSNSGVTVVVATHMTNVELFQGLITFAAIDTSLKGQAPASTAQGRGTITTTITSAMIAGIPVTIDQNGVQVNNQGGAESQAVIQQLTDTLNSALKAAGIQITMTATTTMSDSGKWQGSGGGVQVTAEFAPGNGVPATHVNFTLGQVTGSMYAVPGSSSGSSGNSGGGSCCFGSGGSGGFGSGSGGSTDSTSGSSNTPGAGVKSIISSIIGSLNAGEMLALLFVVQGCSTAAVAAAANAAETAARAGVIPPEEETQ